jgi:hypothetical protein
MRRGARTVMRAGTKTWPYRTRPTMMVGSGVVRSEVVLSAIICGANCQCAGAFWSVAFGTTSTATSMGAIRSVAQKRSPVQYPAPQSVSCEHVFSTELIGKPLVSKLHPTSAAASPTSATM